MTKENIRIINSSQQKYYEECEMGWIEGQLAAYAPVFEQMKQRQHLRILDIGGASGVFAMRLREIFPVEQCEIVVLDSTQYDSWSMLSDKLTFVKGSAENLTKLFAAESFDMVFCNLVVHHFVRESWRSTRDSQLDIMRQIGAVLKHDGRACVYDIFCNGMLHDMAGSRMIYTLTSCRVPLLAKVFKRFGGAMSAGTGVCFLSEKMWLRLFAQSGFMVDYSSYGIDKDPRKFLRLLLVKSHIYGNAFVLNK
jgi:ubiquinone/menaquinone biosynthesis C-methylase UbiE